MDGFLSRSCIWATNYVFCPFATYKNIPSTDASWGLVDSGSVIQGNEFHPPMGLHRLQWDVNILRCLKVVGCYSPAQDLGDPETLHCGTQTSEDYFKKNALWWVPGSVDQQRHAPSMGFWISQARVAWMTLFTNGESNPRHNFLKSSPIQFMKRKVLDPAQKIRIVLHPKIRSMASVP